MPPQTCSIASVNVSPPLDFEVANGTVSGRLQIKNGANNPGSFQIFKALLKISDSVFPRAGFALVGCRPERVIDHPGDIGFKDVLIESVGAGNIAASLGSGLGSQMADSNQAWASDRVLWAWKFFAANGLLPNQLLATLLVGRIIKFKKCFQGITLIHGISPPVRIFALEHPAGQMTLLANAKAINNKIRECVYDNVVQLHTRHIHLV
jgi:hypothetical protein